MEWRAQWSGKLRQQLLPRLWDSIFNCLRPKALGQVDQLSPHQVLAVWTTALSQVAAFRAKLSASPCSRARCLANSHCLSLAASQVRWVCQVANRKCLLKIRWARARRLQMRILRKVNELFEEGVRVNQHCNGGAMTRSIGPTRFKFRSRAHCSGTR